MHTGYRYLRLRKFLARADMSAAKFYRDLWHQRDQFLGDEGKRIVRPSRLKRLFPSWLVDAYTVGRLAASFVRKKMRGAERDVVRLPVHGSFAIERSSGAVKVLDLENERVHTIMRDPRDAGKLRRRIEYARRVEEHSFAPDLVGVDIEGGSFSESYVRGAHPNNFRGCFEAFETSYLGLLLAFMRAEHPQERSLAEYVASLTSAMLRPDGLLHELPPDDRERVRLRVEASAAALADVRGTVPLVLSHGDFFSGNVVVDRGAARALDWAHVGTRSPLHDLYYLAMAHCVRVLSPPELHERFTAMLEMVRTRLQAEDPARFSELATWLSADAVGRHVFYLECIEVPLTRCERPDDRYVAAMLQRVKWFDAFEASVAD